MDSMRYSFHDVLGFGELFDDQKFTSQGAPEIYPSSLLGSSFGLLDLFEDAYGDFNQSTDEEDIGLSAHGEDVGKAAPEEDEDVDIETVDDSACGSIRDSLASTNDTKKTGSIVSKSQDNTIDPLFEIDSLSKLDDYFNGDHNQYLADIDKIEADDLDSLMWQFDNVSKAVGTWSTGTSPALPATALPNIPSLEEHKILPSKATTWNDLEHLEAALFAETSSLLTFASDAISTDIPPVSLRSSCAANETKLSSNYFEKISDHNYCQYVPNDGECSQQEQVVERSDCTADVKHLTVSKQPCFVMLEENPKVQCAKAQISNKYGENKSGRAMSLLRQSFSVKPVSASPSCNAKPASVNTLAVQAAVRPHRAPTITKNDKLSSTATTSQSSCSESSSDSDRKSREDRRRHSRGRYRHRSRGDRVRASHGTSRNGKKYRRSASCSSSSSSRSRSCSRSRLRNESSRREDKDDSKQRAISERRVIYVGGIPRNFTKADLRRRFSGFGEIEDVGVYYRDWGGDNYGFVTFAYQCDAYAAFEKGNDVPGRKFNLCFGGRRAFCETEYADLDGCTAIREEWALRSCRRGDDFDSLLKQTMRHIKKK